MIKQYFNLGLNCEGIRERYDNDARKGLEKDGDVTQNYREGMSLHTANLLEWKRYNSQFFDAVGLVTSKYVEENGNFVYGTADDTGYTLHKYSPGEVVKHHRDGGAFQLDIFLAVVFFLNTPEEGGQLCFPNQGISFEPIENSALVFPAHFAFPHYSKKASTDRYVCVTWLRYNQWRMTTGASSEN